MATSGFLHRGGPWELDKILTTASTALAPLDDVSTSSGQMALGATGTKSLGVFLDSAKLVGDATTTAKQYIRCLPHRTKFLTATKAGTLAAASLKLSFDSSGASAARGIAQNATVNKDLYVYQVVSTGTAGLAVVMFTNPDSDASK